MAYTIQIKRKNATPVSGDLKQGELGLDLTNKKLYVGMGNESPLPVRMGADEIDISEVTGLQSALAGKVPVTRKINNKQLTSNINLTASDVGAISENEKGQANGVAGLDANGKIMVSQLPDTVMHQMEFKGITTTWAYIFNRASFENFQVGWFFIVSEPLTIPPGVSDIRTEFGIEDYSYAGKSLQIDQHPGDTNVIAPGDWLVTIDKDSTSIKLAVLNNNATDLYVPLSRTINGKTLTSNITLTLSDISDTIDCGSW